MTKTPVAVLGRRYFFCASHRLHTEKISAEENRSTYGKCNNAFGHGHNYVVEVTYRGPVDAVTGMVVDLGLLDVFAAQEVVRRFDHQNLNTLAEFADKVPTSENLAVVLHGIFERFPHARLERVQVEETSNNSFIYSGDLLPGLDLERIS